VQVLALPHRTQKSLGGGAPGSAPDRPLRNHESRLIGTVAIAMLVT
jgi:hypothetical protein